MFAERGDRDGDNIKAVVEVLTKFSGLDGLLEIFVGRGQNAGFELDGVCSSYALELFLLEDSE